MATYGIDLGTTFSSVAVARRGVASLVPLERGTPTLASTVLLDSRGAPRVVVGRRAVDLYRAACDAAGTVPDGLVLVRGAKNHTAVFGIVPGGPPWPLGALSLYAQDVAALVLRALADAVRRRPSLPPLDAVVVTHPQRFRNRERRATAQAVHLAGLASAALLPEPDAAAYAYGVHHRAGRTGGAFMVFDFGGGTLDVTVLRREGTPDAPRVEALASYGVQLGGLGIDEAVRARLLDRYAQAIGAPDLTLDQLSEGSREALLGLAEALKIQLNVHASADTNPLARVATRAFAAVTTDGGALPPATLRVTLGELGTWLGEVTERASDCARACLELAGLGWAQLDEVLLVGGSSWLFAVQERLRARCGPARVRLHDDADSPLNPSTVVAAGAALYAASLEDAGEHPFLVDHRGVIPDAFGVRARVADPESAGGYRDTLAVLVPALTRVPYEGRKTFRKRGSSRTLPVEVLEGRTLAEATALGRFVVALPADLPDGAPVDVTLRLGHDGVLGLEVRDPRTGAAHAVGLRDSDGLYSDEALEARRAALAAIPIESEAG